MYLKFNNFRAITLVPLPFIFESTTAVIKK